MGGPFSCAITKDRFLYGLVPYPLSRKEYFLPFCTMAIDLGCKQVYNIIEFIT